VSARVLSQLVVIAFVLLGLLTAGLRYQARHASQTALEDSLWKLTYDLEFSAKDTLSGEPDASLRIGLPANWPHVEVQDPEYIHDRRLIGEIREFEKTGTRELNLTTEHGGEYVVKLEFEIRLSPETPWGQPQASESLTEAALARFTGSEPEFPVLSAVVQGVVRKIPGGKDKIGETLQALFERCSNLRPPGKDDDGADNVEWALANKTASSLGKARSMVTLCRAADIPARLVTGFELRQSEDPQPHVWLEVFYGRRWVPFDPYLGYGYARNMPIQFIPIRRGGEKIVRATGGKIVQEKYSILRLPPEQIALETELRRPSQIFNLTRLPVKMHEVLSLMLLLPFGALITAFFRNVIGIRTFGTFSPALLAMSFIYAAWGTGIVILVVVVTTGLVGRSLLEKLHLLMVPRLSIVLTLIILCVVFSVSLLDYLEWTHSAQAVLLPLVILTIFIERFHVTAEEDSVAFALQLVVGTTIVSAFCYLLLNSDKLGQLLLVYPEAHFFTIALFILIGRYSGYRLVELWRFRDLVDTDNP
jgi:hypothetical protein